MLIFCRGLLVQIVRICAKVGVFSVGATAMDGTKLKVKASYPKTKRVEDLDVEMKEVVK
jgi:hypothetical protein